MISSEHSCISILSGDFVDFHKGKNQVSTRTVHLFASLLFAAVFLFISPFISSSNGILFGELTRLNNEIDAFEKLKERLTGDELELVKKCQKMKLESRIIEEDPAKLDWNWQQRNETQIKKFKDASTDETLEEMSRLEERLRDVMNELDLGMEKMLRGAERDSFGLSSLGQAI